MEIRSGLIWPRQRAALSSANQHAMPPELGRKWGPECLNTRLRLPTLLCEGYSVKLIYLFTYFIYSSNKIKRDVDFQHSARPQYQAESEG